MKTNKDGTPRKMKYNWSTVNWNLSTQTIAQMLGTQKYYVEKMRSKLAPHTKQESAYETIDWSKTDMEIAIETGRKYCTITQMRRRKGLPKVKYVTGRVSACLKPEEWQEVAQVLRMGIQTVATTKLLRIIEYKTKP